MSSQYCFYRALVSVSTPADQIGAVYLLNASHRIDELSGS